MSWFKRRSKQPGWLALGLHADRIDLVHVRRTVGGRPEVALCDSFRKEGSDADTLTRLRKELSLEQYRCTTLLASNQYQLHQIDAPPVPAAEVKSALRWRLKDMIDYPVDTATVEVLEIPSGIEGAGAQSLYAVTAPNAAIARCMQPFEASHLPLAAIDIGELAQRNVAALFEAEGEGVAMLAFSRDDGLLTFTRGGEMYVSRRVEVPVADLIHDDDERRVAAFERVALSVQRSLDHFEREYAFVPLGKLLIAPLPHDVGLLEYLASNIEGRVESADLAGVMELAPVPELRKPDRQAHFLPIIGAALRSEEALAA
jgi:MSHA biogenesis protein MshI